MRRRRWWWGGAVHLGMPAIGPACTVCVRLYGQCLALRVRTMPFRAALPTLTRGFVCAPCHKRTPHTRSRYLAPVGTTAIKYDPMSLPCRTRPPAGLEAISKEVTDIRNEAQHEMVLAEDSEGHRVTAYLGQLKVWRGVACGVRPEPGRACLLGVFLVWAMGGGGGGGGAPERCSEFVFLRGGGGTPGTAEALGLVVPDAMGGKGGGDGGQKGGGGRGKGRSGRRGFSGVDVCAHRKGGGPGSWGWRHAAQARAPLSLSAYPVSSPPHTPSSLPPYAPSPPLAPRTCLLLHCTAGGCGPAAGRGGAHQQVPEAVQGEAEMGEQRWGGGDRGGDAGGGGVTPHRRLSVC